MQNRLFKNNLFNYSVSVHLYIHKFEPKPNQMVTGKKGLSNFTKSVHLSPDFEGENHNSAPLLCYLALLNYPLASEEFEYGLKFTFILKHDSSCSTYALY